MNTLAFDALKAAKALRQAGFEEAQAEAVVTTASGAIGDNVATKADLQLLRSDLRELEQRMTIKLGAMMVAAAGFVAVVQRLI